MLCPRIAPAQSSAPVCPVAVPAAVPSPPRPLPFPVQTPGAPAPVLLGERIYLSGALDLRTRTSTTGRRGGIWINNAELDFQRPLSVKGKSVGSVVLQLIGEDPADPDPRSGSARDVQVGEAYVVYRLPVHTETDSVSYLKVGQFQVPFGLLATYDPHLSLVPPLSDQSLGLRTDFGVALSGTLYGYLDYNLSITNGTGPDHAGSNPDRLGVFRLGRTFDTRNGVVNVGGSLLSGRLPVTDLSVFDSFAVELPPSSRVRADRFNLDRDRFAPKSRIAGDGTYTYGRITARGEAEIGADKNNRILGYYAEGNYSFGPRANAVLGRSLFVYPVGSSNASREFVGASYRTGTNITLSTLYEYLRDVPRDSPGRVRHRLTLQVLLRF